MKTAYELDVILSKENNNMVLAPVTFYPHSPLHTWKVTDICVKLNCCNAKI